MWYDGGDFHRSFQEGALRMLAVLVNTLAVLLGSTVGLLARKGIPEKVSGAIMTAISLCTL